MGTYYTICTREEWNSEYFDTDYCEQKYGSFETWAEARKEADKLSDGIVIEIS